MPVINRPGVVRAVLETPSSLIDSLINFSGQKKTFSHQNPFFTKNTKNQNVMSYKNQIGIKLQNSNPDDTQKLKL